MSLTDQQLPSPQITQIDPGPPIRTGERSRLTRRITRALLKSAVRNEVIARELAAEIVEDLINEYGGGSLYVPIADCRPGGTGQASIETHLRSVMTVDQLLGTGNTQRGLINRLVADTAAKYSVSVRTVFRVLERVRMGA